MDVEDALEYIEEQEKAENPVTDPSVKTDEQTEVDQMREIFQSEETPVVDDVHVHSFDQDDHLEG